jgi:cbb3-type cytochrome oxidase maturation protein
MNIVFLLIPLGIVLVGAAAAALLWAVDSGQYDGDVEENGRIALETDPTATALQESEQIVLRRAS